MMHGIVIWGGVEFASILLPFKKELILISAYLIVQIMMLRMLLKPPPLIHETPY
jgi:hypothetical protein